MSVFIALDGSAQFANGQLTFTGNPDGGIIDRVTSLSLHLALLAGRVSVRTCALVAGFTRDASRGTAADLLPLRYQFGEEGRAEKRIVPCQILFIDDTQGGAAGLRGQLTAAECQVVAVSMLDAAGAPVQSVTLHLNGWDYSDLDKNPSLSGDKQLAPVVVPGFAHS